MNVDSAGSQRLRNSVAAMERERAGWARELDDETLQRLVAVRMRLAASRKGPDAALRETVDGAIEMLAEEISALRSLIAELRPLALDQLGLGQALEGLALRHWAGAAVDVRVECSLPVDASARLDPELESALFRVAQEAVDNAVAHADGRIVEIRVGRLGGVISLTVRDDGNGFDPEAPTGGLGLLAASERVALLGGRLTVDSAPGDGTSVEARVPVGARVAAQPVPESSRPRASA